MIKAHIETDIQGLIVIEPRIHEDSRGFFYESYNAGRYKNIGIEEDFVQDNFSFSRKGVLRGLHLQNPCGQGKLVSVIQGEVWDVAVDVRHNSSTFGKWFGLFLDGTTKRQFYIPPGFAHGFVVMSDTALFHYKCSNFYNPNFEYSLAWNDPDINIEWPSKDVFISKRDQNGISLKEYESNLNKICSI